MKFTFYETSSLLSARGCKDNNATAGTIISVLYSLLHTKFDDYCFLQAMEKEQHSPSKMVHLLAVFSNTKCVATAVALHSIALW